MQETLRGALQGLVHSHGWPVGPVRSHGLDHISDTDNTRLKDDLIPGQTQRIARAVHPFMVLQHNIEHDEFTKRKLAQLDVDSPRVENMA